MNPLRGPGRVYSTAHEASLKLHSFDYFSTRWALRSAPQSAFLPPLLYNTQCHSRFNSLEERSGTNSRSKGSGQLGSSPYGRDRTQVIFLHETCQKGLDIQIPSSAHIRIAGEEVQLPWYQAMLMLKRLRKMRIKKAANCERKECHSSSCVCTSRGGHTFDKITTKCDGNSWCGLEYDFNNIEDTTSFKQNREIINHSYKRDGALQRDAHPPKHGGGSKMGTADISDHNAIYLTMHQNKQTNIMENGVFNKKKKKSRTAERTDNNIGHS